MSAAARVIWNRLSKRELHDIIRDQRARSRFLVHLVPTEGVSDADPRVRKLARILAGKQNLTFKDLYGPGYRELRLFGSGKELAVGSNSLSDPDCGGVVIFKDSLFERLSSHGLTSQELRSLGADNSKVRRVDGVEREFKDNKFVEAAVRSICWLRCPEYSDILMKGPELGFVPAFITSNYELMPLEIKPEDVQTVIELEHFDDLYTQGPLVAGDLLFSNA